MTNYKQIAKEYYTAVGKKDLSALEKFLHPDVKLKGPLSKPEGKSAVIESVKFFTTQFKTLKVEDVFAEQDRAVVVYITDFPGVGEIKSVALVSFKDDLIAQLELFFDPRPFIPK